MPQPPEDLLHELLGRLTLPEKVRLLTGRDFWSTWPMEKIGLRRMVFSDGPSGVRGEVWDERDPSLALPSPTALASSWDRELAGRYGSMCAAEARRKNVDVVLGPTINLHRSPLGGRHFEAFSEDPLLTGELAASYVRGLQEHGVAATPKHYVANDSETDRFTVDVRVDERTLREVYLRPFETAVDAGAWMVMSAYNAVNGVTATENDLLESPLNAEWGFDGVVISDWMAVRSLASARSSQDLVFPGPDSPWSEGLVDAVREGSVPERAVDRKVLRLLRLAARVGALDAHSPDTAPPIEATAAFAREAAVAGTVLMSNDGVLPLRSPKSVALIGDHARQPRIGGGGSATVLPEHEVSPWDGLRAVLGEQIRYAAGALVSEGIRALPQTRITDPATGTSGVSCRFLDEKGEELSSESRLRTKLTWLGGGIPQDAYRLELRTTFLPEETGTLLFGVETVGQATLHVDGATVFDGELSAQGDDLAAGFTSPGSDSGPARVVAGTPVEIQVDYALPDLAQVPGGFATIGFGIQEDETREDALIAEAARVAAESEVAVVVVGTGPRTESEGVDRTTLALPGRQDELVEAVVRANPNTVVVLNAGAPVLMPWRDSVRAVLLTYFGGQEIGHALADVLLGRAEPGGRLTTTWPASESDVPVLDVVPQDGTLEYAEGVHIGHRAWLKTGATPAFPFGHGLGYTKWEVESTSAPSAVDRFAEFAVEVRLLNAGSREGKHVVQVYASRANSRYDRPVRWLAGFTCVHANRGTSTTATVHVSPRTFAVWDRGEWVYEPGRYELTVAHSAGDLAGAVTIDLT